MALKKFRKLDIELPRQPSVDQRPWLIAGIFIALIILMLSAFAYVDNGKKGNFPRHQRDNSFKAR